MARLQQKFQKNKPIASPCLSVRQSICSKNITVQDTSVVFDELNSVAFSPQANYTDRATATCRRS
jgi:hypothetical protein